MAGETKKSKIKFGPNVSINKGSFKPHPKVDVDTKNIFTGIGGEYNIIDTDDTNLKISGNVGKGFSEADVTYPGGKELFKDASDKIWDVKIKLTKKFSKGGTVKNYIKDLL
jgi:hypothetical protein